MELALFGPLLLEDTSVFDLHRTGDEPDFTAFFHQASYPPVIIEFLYGTMKDSWVIDPPSPEHQPAGMNLQNSVISVFVTKTKQAYLFDMEEVFGLKGDGHAWNRDVIVVTGTVADICANSKRNWFGLPGGGEMLESQTMQHHGRSKKRRLEVFRWSRRGEQ